MVAQPMWARGDPAGDQVIDVIVDHGYRPQSIVARAGVQLRVVFRRRDSDECTDRVVFSSPHLVRRLARGADTTVVLPPQPPGEIRFTCGMGRYHGQIALKADRPSLWAELRARFSRGGINQEESERARNLALAGDRECGP
jgi:plastocyanin domain-containing protein